MIDYQIDEGWLQSAEQFHSPHQNERPAGCEPELLVIHNISVPPNDFGGGLITQLFMGELADPERYAVADAEVSAHLLILRTGHVRQFVSFDQRAWHAGVSRFADRENCNDFSIGIELEGDDVTPFTDQQYQHLRAIITCLQNTYPAITRDRIVGHSDIAPGRKTDPGPLFDWARLYTP